MGDGFSETNNLAPGKGRHLRAVGDELGDKPEYSDQMDYTIGRTSLNAQGVYMDEAQHRPERSSSSCCKERGLVLKEPLS